MTDRATADPNVAADSPRTVSSEPPQPGAAVGRRTWLGLAAVAGLFASVPLLSQWLARQSSAEAPALHPSRRELPNLRFTDERAAPTRLAAFRGRVVLLNVWATWCPPCRAEMPTLDRLQAMLGSAAFEVVTLSIDEDGLRAVRAFFTQTGVRHLRPYIDSFGEAAASLASGGIPVTLLIDRNGREIMRKLGPAEWDQPASVRLIRDALDEPVTPGPPAPSAIGSSG